MMVSRIGVLAALCGLALGCDAVLGGASDNGASDAGGAKGSSPEKEQAEAEAITGAVEGLGEGAPVTLLGRLTNAEFVRGLEILLELQPGAPELTSAVGALAPEASVRGLQNDAATQALTQVAIAGFERLALSAFQVFVGGVQTNAELAEKLGCVFVNDQEMTECLISYGDSLLTKASRALPAEQNRTTARAIVEAVVALQEAEEIDASSFESRVLQLQALVTYVALSPDFLLFIEGRSAEGKLSGDPVELTAHEVATRLSFFLGGEPPDEALLSAAAEGRLGTPQERAEQAARLLELPGGADAFVGSLVGWLGINQNTADGDDLESLSAFLQAWIVQEGTFDEFYNGVVDVPSTDGATSSLQVGVLGTSAFLSAHTFPPTPAFITRGAFVVEQLLCQELPDDLPAEAFGAGEMTEREVFEVHSAQACATCHIYFDSFGAAFQNFEPEGNTFDASFAPLGESFELNPTGDIAGDVSNLEELGEKMGASERAPACMAQLFYRHAMRRSLRGGDGEVVTRLVEEWTTGDMSLRTLLLGIVSADEFAYLYP